MVKKELINHNGFLVKLVLPDVPALTFCHRGEVPVVLITG